MPDVDYATWFTKSQAADAIGVTTKTIEQLAKDRKLEQASWRRPTGGPALAVYNPDDVARIAQERQPTPTPFVLPAMPPSRNGNGARQPGARRQSLAVSAPPAPGPDDLVRQFLQGLVRAASTPPTSQNSEKLFLTISEAAEWSGLSETYLRRLIKTDKLAAVRDRGWRIRRKDLEQL